MRLPSGRSAFPATALMLIKLVPGCDASEPADHGSNTTAARVERSSNGPRCGSRRMASGSNNSNSPWGDRRGAQAVLMNASVNRSKAEWYWIEQPWRTGAGWMGRGDFHYSGDYRHPDDDTVESFDIDGAVAADNRDQLETLLVLHGIPRIYDCTQRFVPGDVTSDHPDPTYEFNTECNINIEPYPRIEGLPVPNPPGPQPPPPPPGADAWGRYVGAVTSYMVARGITYFELFNEPDDQFKSGTDPQMAKNPPQDVGAFINDYRAMVESSVYKKAEDARLILPAFQSPGYGCDNDSCYLPPNGWNYLAWSSVNTATLLQQLEGAAIHAYDWPFRAWTLADYTRNALTNRRDIPIWITEHAWQDDPALPTSTRDQLSANYVFQEAVYARVAGVVANLHFATVDIVGYRGLLNTGGARRPAGNVMKFVGARLLEPIVQRQLSILPTDSLPASFDAFVTAQPITQVVFDDDCTGGRMTALWSNRKNAAPIASITPQPGMCVELFDQEGRIVPISYDSTGKYSISLPEAPAEARETGAGSPVIGGEGRLLVETPCAVPDGDTVLIIDSSGSMIWNDPQDRRKDASKAFITLSPPANTIGVVDFDGNAIERLPLTSTTNVAAIEAAIDAIDSNGSTNIGLGVSTGFTTLNRGSQTGRAAILLTDGDGAYANNPHLLYKNKGWPIYTLGFGDANKNLLCLIARETGGDYNMGEVCPTSSSQVPQALRGDDIRPPQQPRIAASSLTPDSMVCAFQHIRSKIDGGNGAQCDRRNISPGQSSVEFEVPAGQGYWSFTASWAAIPSPLAGLTLTSPSGRIIDGSTVSGDVAHGKGRTYEVFRLARPEGGRWTARFISQLAQAVVFGTAVASGKAGNRPPDVSAAAASVAKLWPPNHHLVDEEIEGVTDPDGDSITITITGITQDEPVSGLGSGDTSPDAGGVGAPKAQLLAERAGDGDGRVYQIKFIARDSRGASSAGLVTVCVPHGQSTDACVNSGQVYDSTQP